MSSSQPPVFNQLSSQESRDPSQTGTPTDGRARTSVSASPPYVTYTIIGLTVLLFVIQQAELFFGISVPFLLDVKNNELIVRGEYWRLLTPMFLHVNILHIAFNMYALSILGPGLERYFGHRRFAMLYLLSGFAGNVFSFLLTPARSLGASTAVFGLLGAQGVFLYQNRRLFAGVARQAINQIVMIVVINLLIGLTPGLDNWGHLGGLVGGVLFTWFSGPIFSVEQTWEGLTVTDTRSRRRVILAALILLAFFVALAFAGIIRGVP